jgi:hypothetical protein
MSITLVGIRDIILFTCCLMAIWCCAAIAQPVKPLLDKWFVADEQFRASKLNMMVGRIDLLEKQNGYLQTHVGMLEKRVAALQARLSRRK